MKAILEKTPTKTRRVHEPYHPRVTKPSEMPLAGAPFAPLLQRHPLCPCGGGCPRCLQAKLIVGQPDDQYEREAEQIADRVMRMELPESTATSPTLLESDSDRLQRSCLGCTDKEEEDEKLQTKAESATTPQVTPALESQLHSLRGGGRPLPESTRNFFEPRFGQDFSQVRIHTDAQAAQAARSVNARAFTVGKDVVLGEGQYSPDSDSGRRLLAHELVHVRQQRATSPSTHALLLQRKQRTPNTIDSRAEALINLAQDTSVAIDQRAQRIVAQILATYYPSDASKFTQINWVETNPGVTAVCASTGTPTMTCTMEVGRYFVEHISRSGIARRVLQIGHEIQHVNQHRKSLGGGTRRHEREFLSFHWEATAPEAAGTGRMPHATRVALIDAAIQHYNCFTTAEKSTYNTQYQQLLTLRQSEQAASGNPATPVPAQCGG
jgi:hypothetical protein